MDIVPSTVVMYENGKHPIPYNVAIKLADVLEIEASLLYDDFSRFISVRKLCEWKGVEILEAEACPDHIHMLVSIPPKISVSSFMGYLKGKSSLMIFDKHANMKYRYSNREFWCRGYYVDTVGKNKKAIAEYIRNQLQEDLAYEQMSIKELIDPFTGEPVHASKK